jgi:hypothetical protein
MPSIAGPISGYRSCTYPREGDGENSGRLGQREGVRHRMIGELGGYRKKMKGSEGT